ncbi:hypothetical protein D3C81_1435840 [compost metagenome]
MLTEPAILAAVDIATGEAAEVLDPRDRLPVDRLRSGLQGVMFEQRKRHRQPATGEKTAAQRHITALHPQGIDQRAFGVRAVGLRGHAQTGAAQGPLAQLRIIAQTHQLVPSQQVRRGLDVERRPGIPLRRHLQPATPQTDHRATDDQQHQQEPAPAAHVQHLKN